VGFDFVLNCGYTLLNYRGAFCHKTLGGVVIFESVGHLVMVLWGLVGVVGVGVVGVLGYLLV
jgi:hypothetical protein